MRKARPRFALAGLLLSLLVVTMEGAPPHAADSPGEVKSGCTLHGKKLWGRVQVVDAFPDIKVQVVDAFPDLRVKKVDVFADACGKWQFVDVFPDLKIQLVTAFPDLKIKYVDAFPGSD